MNETSSQVSAGAGGISFTGVLTILFIALKLLKIISWSWFWVLSPIIFSVGFVIVLLIVLWIIALVESK